MQTSLRRRHSASRHARYDAWRGAARDGAAEFTSTTCGVRIQVPETWTISDLGVKNGTCLAYFNSGPYQGTEHKRQPSIVLLARQPKGAETLTDFARTFMSRGSYVAIPPPRCPATTCVAMEGTRAGMYGKDGDGRALLVFFERSPPQYPGLVFEYPQSLPTSKSDTGPRFYRPRPVPQRIPGTLYYFAMLDTATSIEEPARKDFDYLLQHMLAE